MSLFISQITFLVVSIFLSGRPDSVTPSYLSQGLYLFELSVLTSGTIISVSQKSISGTVGSGIFTSTLKSGSLVAKTFQIWNIPKKIIVSKNNFFIIFLFYIKLNSIK